VTSMIYYIIFSVMLVISAVAVSTKWIWYEIFAGDNCLNSLPRIKYKINCDDTFFPSSKHTGHLFAFYSLSTQAGTTLAKPGEPPLVVSVWWPQCWRWYDTQRSPIMMSFVSYTCLTALYFLIYRMIASTSLHRRSLNAVSKPKK